MDSVQKEIIDECVQKYGVIIDFDTKYIHASSNSLVYNINGICYDTNENLELAYIKTDIMTSGFGRNEFHSYTDRKHQIYYNMNKQVKNDILYQIVLLAK